MNDGRDQEGIEDDLGVNEIVSRVLAPDMGVPERTAGHKEGGQKGDGGHERLFRLGTEPLQEGTDQNTRHQGQSPQIEPAEEIPSPGSEPDLGALKPQGLLSPVS